MMYTALHGMDVSQIKGYAQLFYLTKYLNASNGSNKIHKKAHFQWFFKPIRWRYFLLVKQNKTVMHDVHGTPRHGCVPD